MTSRLGCGVAGRLLQQRPGQVDRLLMRRKGASEVLVVVEDIAEVAVVDGQPAPHDARRARALGERLCEANGLLQHILRLVAATRPRERNPHPALNPGSVFRCVVIPGARRLPLSEVRERPSVRLDRLCVLSLCQLDIFPAGYPKSQAINCGSSVLDAAIEQTVSAGSSSLSYDAATDQYSYVWKTEKSWAGTCRQLTIQFADSSTQYANFKFK